MHSACVDKLIWEGLGFFLIFVNVMKSQEKKAAIRPRDPPNKNSCRTR